MDKKTLFACKCILLDYIEVIETSKLTDITLYNMRITKYQFAHNIVPRFCAIHFAPNSISLTLYTGLNIPSSYPSITTNMFFRERFSTKEQEE